MLMELLADEHVKQRLRASLETQGIPVHDVEDNDLKGATDAELFEYARGHDLVILTNDDDFEELAADHEHPGVIFITSQYAGSQAVAREIVRLTDQLGPADVHNGTFYVP